MQQLKRFWPAIESLPGPVAVAGVWQHLLGPEHDLVQPWLRPRLALATSIPCPRYPGAMHRVVDHGAGEYVAVCPEGCETQTITKADRVAYGLDHMSLMVTVTQAFGWALQLDQSKALPRTEQVATHTPTAGYRFPVYLTIATQRDEMLASVRTVVATCRSPFILLAPTRRLWTDACDQLLASRNALFLPLEEVLALGGQGRMVLQQPRDNLLAGFHQVVLPPKEAQDGAAFFPTPDGAAWRDVKIVFKDNHTLTVDVQGVKGAYHYRQMGMADGRNGEPNKQWELLHAFAEDDGTLTWKSPHASRKNQKRRETLAKDLQRFFRIDGDPIQQHGKGWQTRFSVSLVD